MITPVREDLPPGDIFNSIGEKQGIPFRHQLDPPSGTSRTEKALAGIQFDGAVIALQV